MDDFLYEPVPEPGTLALSGSASRGSARLGGTGRAAS
jgi:hypothetical protein